MIFLRCRVCILIFLIELWICKLKTSILFCFKNFFYISDVDSKKGDGGSNNDQSDDDDHGITSPVRSFLEKSKRQVEHYLREKFSLGHSSSTDNVPDTDEEAESILINHDQETNTITGIVTDAEGVDHRFSKSMDDTDQSSTSVFKSLENFLNPDSPAIKK